MNYWGEGNHQQRKPHGWESPGWLFGAAVLGLGVVVGILVRILAAVDR